jgi:hypothetical protein
MNHEQSTFKRRIPFTSFEDQIILSYVHQYGLNNWKLISQHLIDRTSRQCKDRYHRYLSLSCKNVPWTREEDEELFQSVIRFGQCWKQIIEQFPGRTEMSLKKRWKNKTSKKKSKNLQVDEELNEFLMLFKWAFSS